MWMIQAYSNLGLHPKLEKKHDKLPNNLQLRIVTHEKMQEKNTTHLAKISSWINDDQCKLQEAIFPNQPTNQPSPQNSRFLDGYNVATNDIQSCKQHLSEMRKHHIGRVG